MLKEFVSFTIHTFYLENKCVHGGGGVLYVHISDHSGRDN